MEVKNPKGRRTVLSSARVAGAQVATLARLDRRLARAELRRKGATLGAGAGAAAAALLLLPLVIGFGLAAAAAALTLAVATWLALLIVFGLLLFLVAGLAVASIALIRRAGPLKPEQALEEARRKRRPPRRLRRG